MKKVWKDDAWEHYLYWQKEDKRILKRINQLINDIERSSYVGIGRPEALRYDLQGWWSRRIDETNRLVYRIVGDSIEIASCKLHYDE
jgi:toxin YoeB